MKILDTYNALVGAVIAVLTYIFGEHWMLFALFLAFNVADWLTGWVKSRLAHKESSSAGWKAHVKRGNSTKVLERTDKYLKNLWKEYGL